MTVSAIATSSGADSSDAPPASATVNSGSNGDALSVNVSADFAMRQRNVSSMSVGDGAATTSPTRRNASDDVALARGCRVYANPELFAFISTSKRFFWAPLIPLFCPHNHYVVRPMSVSRSAFDVLVIGSGFALYRHELGYGGAGTATHFH